MSPLTMSQITVFVVICSDKPTMNDSFSSPLQCIVLSFGYYSVSADYNLNVTFLFSLSQLSSILFPDVKK